ncbi:MAG: hypothetical protein KGQ52_06365 [Alphaproteobacteria bacterium]|nr:hypothetical protein [Alphaproteobacteria bacterium]
MQFNRSELNDSAVSLARSPAVDDSCIGRNYLIEENVTDQRRSVVEGYEPLAIDVREVVNSYFRDSVQGVQRGHLSSTFDETINHQALLPVSVEPTQKIIRLERIDRHLEPIGGLDFMSLTKALQDNDRHRLAALADQFLNYGGERPAFSAFKSEVSDDLNSVDLLPRIIDRLGLYHHYPFVSGKPYRFALMEYTAAEVIDQAKKKNMNRCFALATVLECQNNPAFFPVPRATSHGFTVDLRERNPAQPSVREMLHIRFDYSWRHIKRIAEWTGADTPDIVAARDRHLATLRTATGCADFGDVGV